ncbi:hypothetical protein ACM1PE_11490 [Achromobacter sp. PD1]|uniref:hypothetical protein n=1 Tax=Achromobacter TaxID=222 RepID=UPI0027BA8191|nr:hypothetical protein [Achromobacter aegrifaciens]WLW59028.1 hypothetical protein RA224_17435 [Achromobacter aegrifaciens]
MPARSQGLLEVAATVRCVLRSELRTMTKCRNLRGQVQQSSLAWGQRCCATSSRANEGNAAFVTGDVAPEGVPGANSKGFQVGISHSF